MLHKDLIRYLVLDFMVFVKVLIVGIVKLLVTLTVRVQKAMVFVRIDNFILIVEGEISVASLQAENFIHDCAR